jgi:predicted component of type VI protein secretion system
MIGTFKNEKDVKTQIEEWLRQYKLDSPDAHSDAEKAKQPLAGYTVRAEKDKLGRAGIYDVEIDLELHYQVEAVNVRMSIVGQVSGPQD